MAYTYAAIDCETTGLNLYRDQVLEIGVVLDNIKNRVEKKDLYSYLLNLPVFHCYINHNRIQGHPKALAMNAKILSYIADYESTNAYSFTESRINYSYENYSEYIKAVENKRLAILKPEDVHDKLFNFFYSHGLVDKRKDSVVVAGKNFGGFDAQILANDIPKFDSINDKDYSFKFKHRVIDPSMLYFDTGIDIVPPSLEECLSRAGIYKTISHTAVEDCLDVIKVLKLSKKLYK